MSPSATRGSPTPSRDGWRPTPEQDPDWSNHTLGRSIIHWRPSTVANATGGQVVDPRSGEIIKGEVNMYHNVMNLLRNWYFIQVSPLDARGRSLQFPDALMGKLVEYVVTHEVGHSIGFPHNMKASHMYHPDSLRSVSFLQRMGGHVSTLMDYSRFNYVAQPEDNIPVELLIPQVGPYDKYSVMWAYKPIPGARTPDEEWTTLDGWSRWQDTMPVAAVDHQRCPERSGQPDRGGRRHGPGLLEHAGAAQPAAGDGHPDSGGGTAGPGLFPAR